MDLRHLAASTLCAAACLACSSDDDVVAVGSLESESSQDAGSSSLPETPGELGCQAGDYVGNFSGTIGVGAPGVEISGFINFRLVPVLDGEFLEVTQSELDGTTSTGSIITAEVGGSGNGCTEGEITAHLTEGRLGNLAFEGVVTGTYDAARRAFLGEWQSVFPETQEPVGSGVWVAIYADASSLPEAGPPVGP